MRYACANDSWGVPLPLRPAGHSRRRVAATLQPERPSYDTSRRGIATVEDGVSHFLSLAANQERIKLERKPRDLTFTECRSKWKNWNHRREVVLRPPDVLAARCACVHVRELHGVPPRPVY